MIIVDAGQPLAADYDYHRPTRSHRPLDAFAEMVAFRDTTFNVHEDAAITEVTKKSIVETARVGSSVDTPVTDKNGRHPSGRFHKTRLGGEVEEDIMDESRRVVTPRVVWTVLMAVSHSSRDDGLAFMSRSPMSRRIRVSSGWRSGRSGSSRERGGWRTGRTASTSRTSMPGRERGCHAERRADSREARFCRGAGLRVELVDVRLCLNENRLP